jgi:hypothetical protein
MRRVAKVLGIEREAKSRSGFRTSWRQWHGEHGEYDE